MTNVILEQKKTKIAIKNGCGSCCTVSTSGPSRPPFSGPLSALLLHPQQGPMQKNLALIKDQDCFGMNKSKIATKNAEK